MVVSGDVFDVSLSNNSKDKPSVEDLLRFLRSAIVRSLTPRVYTKKFPNSST